jgi:hypothetical protein
MKYLLPLILITLSVGFGCKSTKKAYEKGDYETAVFNSVDRLRSSPKNKKSRQTLALAYPAMVEFLEDKIVNAKRSADPLKWESIVQAYKLLNRAYTEIKRSPAASDVVPNPKNYQSELTQAENNAAEARYILGDRALVLAEQGDKEAAREAFYHFDQIEEFRPGYKDARQKAQYGRELATIYVKVEPIPMHSRTLELSNEFFENQIFEYLVSRNYNPFVQFYSGKSSHYPENGPDHIVRMIFDDFVVGQAFVKETVHQRVKDSVVISEVSVGDTTVDVYGTVKAEVHQFSKQITSTGLLDFKIIDARSGTIISQEKFPGTYVWIDRWGFYNGDDRALNSEDNQFVRKSREASNPPPQQLFIEFTKPIFTNLTRFANNFYESI